MRDPKRITKILDELEEYWNNHPNWRLGQVMSNLSYELLGDNDPFFGDNDPFFIEDEWLLELLKLKNEKNL